MLIDLRMIAADSRGDPPVKRRNVVGKQNSAYILGAIEQDTVLIARFSISYTLNPRVNKKVFGNTQPGERLQVGGRQSILWGRRPFTFVHGEMSN
jgi:hypothetical protein